MLAINTRNGKQSLYGIYLTTKIENEAPNKLKISHCIS